jgi:hypothetical protein
MNSVRDSCLWFLKAPSKSPDEYPKTVFKNFIFVYTLDFEEHSSVWPPWISDPTKRASNWDQSFKVPPSPGAEVHACSTKPYLLVNMPDIFDSRECLFMELIFSWG